MIKYQIDFSRQGIRHHLVEAFPLFPAGAGDLRPISGRCQCAGYHSQLENRCIKSPSGKAKWPKRSIDAMLSNEKYCGNVLVVKSYTTPFPEVKRVTNRGEKQHYLAVGAHPVIISSEQFEAVQEEKKRRSNKVVTEDGCKRSSTRYSSKKKENLQ